MWTRCLSTCRLLGMTENESESDAFWRKTWEVDPEPTPVSPEPPTDPTTKEN